LCHNKQVPVISFTDKPSHPITEAKTKYTGNYNLTFYQEGGNKQKDSGTVENS
jgi:hypothetical protein